MTTGSKRRGHLIGGDQVPAASGATFDDVDPATALPIATLARGDAEDVDKAVQSARSAQPGWAEIDPFERGRILQRLDCRRHLIPQRVVHVSPGLR